jgi:NTE family protein
MLCFYLANGGIFRMNRRPKIGLALGGGGARGFAHIGVLKVLEREKIPIDLIIGTSIGAVVGAAYVVNPNAAALERLIAANLDSSDESNTGLKILGKVHLGDVSKTDFLNKIKGIAQKEVFLTLALFRAGLLSASDIENCLKPFVSDTDMKETKIRYAATAVDLVSGAQVVLKHGSLLRAVMASCAVPGFIPAVSWDRMILVDGGLLGALPAAAARKEGMDIVIGVDVGSRLCPRDIIGDGVDTINRATEIMGYHLNSRCRDCVDILVEPAVSQIRWTDFAKHKALIREGEKAAETKVDEIQDMMDQRVRKRVLRWVRKRSSSLKNEAIKAPFPLPTS